MDSDWLLLAHNVELRAQGLRHMRMEYGVSDCVSRLYALASIVYQSYTVLGAVKCRQPLKRASPARENFTFQQKMVII